MIKDVSGLGSLTSLAHLYLHNNKIEDVSGLRSLMGLTNLRLDSNQIEDVSPIAGLLERFGRIREKPSNISSELVLGDNPLKAPPLEIVRQGKEAVLAWFAARGDTGERLLNQVKVLLVGDGYAGKTSLVQRVLHDTFEPNQGQTHGIRIEEWSTDGPKDDPMVVKFWDFGGQEIMHATHQFFLSKRCLYIVVQSARDEDRTWYWLHHIRGFGGDSPVLVVINKIDENPGFEVDENQLQREFPNIIGFYRLSCKKGRGIAGFKNRLCEELPKIELASAIWPERWFQIKEALESMEKPYITRARYRAVCKQHTVDTTDQQRTLLAFLHDLGVMLSFPDLHLRETQVLNPHWATNGVYKIINAKQLADHHGRLDLDKLDEVLAPTEEMPQSYPSETHPFLVELMRKFELCYPLEGEDAVLVPDLLAKNSPADFELRGDTLTFLFDYTFLPPSVMPRFMVRLHKDISFAWRTGVILYDKDTDSRAAVLANQPANRISIEVSGPKRRDYLLVVRFFLRSIHATFTNLKVHEKVQLPDDPVPEHALAYSVLKKAEERGIAELPALNGNFYNVSDLLGRVQIKAPTNEEEERAFLRRTVTTILEKVDKEKPVNFLEDVFDLSSPYLINLNAAKKYLLQIIKKDRR
ncbi:MAG: COR domain-containing protein [Acidobacteriota bacterium]|nr:COR domain-containing protein [Acidobacteriota bacterium]